VIAVIIPPLIEQTTSFTANLPQYLNSLGINEIMSEQIISQLFSQIGSLPTQALRFGVSVFSNILGLVSVLIFAFYLLLAREKLDDQLGFLFGEGKRKEIAQVLNILEAKLGGWARGQMALMLLVGLLTYIGLTILGIPFALPLAILAGLLEIIPYIGPIFAAIPSVVIGLSISPLMGLATIALAFLANQVENYLFVPKVMEKSVGVSPIVTLLALAIGFRLAGVIGIIISIPLVLTIQTLSKIYLFSSK
jgi:predicted PurR-regulated permease PerM